MKLINSIKSKLSGDKKLILYGAAIMFVIAACILLKFYGTTNTEEANTYSVEKEYKTLEEQELAKDIKEYLARYVILEEEAAAKITDSAVKNYNAALASDVRIITDMHSEALEKNMNAVLKEYITEEQITEEDNTALTSGICSLIWDMVLNKLESSQLSSAPEYEQQYMELAESLQEQIDALKGKSTNISINAKLKQDEVYTEYVAGAIQSYNDTVSSDIDSLRGELSSQIDSAMKSNETITTVLVDEQLSEFKSEINKELQNKYGNVQDGEDGKDGSNGKDGKDGKDGKNGVDGEDGEDGKDGKDGVNGKSTYIAYADDAQGNGFSLAPTETTKYIGTCITDETIQPTSAKSYGNWQLYRTYIITSQTDENGTTLYIH